MFVSGALIISLTMHWGEQSAWCSRSRKPPPWPSFVVCAPQISLKDPQFLWTQPEFPGCPRFDRYGFQEKKFTGPRRQKGKKRRSIASWLERHRRRKVSSSSWPVGVVLVEQAAFHTPDLRDRQGWSMLSDCSNFEDEETAALDLCTLEFYDVQGTPGERR